MLVLGRMIEHARRTREWLVVVAPERSFRGLLRVLPGIAPAESRVLGCTVLLSDGGRVTLTETSRPVHGDGYRVAFLGVDGAGTPREEIAMHAWREAARGTLSLGDRPGELRIG